MTLQNQNANLVNNRFIKVAILEDEGIARIGLEALLNVEDDIEVIASFGDPEPLFESIDIDEPDVVTIDLKLRGSYDVGFSTIKEIKQNHKNIKVLVITSYPEVNNLLRAIKEEVDGFTIKGKDANKYPTIPEIIRMVANGVGYYEKSVFSQLAPFMVDDNDFKRSKDIHFTKREIEILKLLVEELTNTEIASKLGISINTVKFNLTNIYQKLNVTTRLAAMTVVKINNLISN